MISSGVLTIKHIWEVKADSSYKNTLNMGYPLKGFILLRTLTGQGYVRLHDGRILKCQTETLVKLIPENIAAYGTSIPLWSFWWIECVNPSTADFPENTVLDVEQIPNESQMLIENTRNFALDKKSATFAATNFLALTCAWYKKWRDQKAQEKPNRAKLRNILMLMETSAADPLPISKLARKLNLCEGRFRHIFTRYVGISPKKYYENLRLSQAASMLRGTDMKLAEIAGKLNYSSEFHLSKSFKRHFGISPSGFRSGSGKSIDD